MAPVLVLTLAVGAAQSLAPRVSEAFGTAELPRPPVLAASPVPDELASSPPPGMLAGLEEPQTRLSAKPPPTTIAARSMAPTRVSICALPTAEEKARTFVADASSPSAFGRLLAQAAVAQTSDLVVYTDEYRRIGFPMGDVPTLYGVCTDVIVRAYRSLGIDLQELVHKARLGTGDTNIDHRRTQTLRRFFARYGTSLPVTDFGEDYQPGDTVTYSRPGGKTSQSHIAIVADVTAPSGRPMIVHNRGWGPQLEDALFANEITGHYRFTGSAPASDAAAPLAAPPPSRLAQTPLPAQVSASAAP